MSPSRLLNGSRSPGSPTLSSFVTKATRDVQYEGEMLRIVDAEDQEGKEPSKPESVPKCKRYWYVLLGKELYVYKKRSATKHKGMHSLVGVFIRDEGEKQLDSSTMLYGFKLTFPPNTVKQYYCESKEQKEEWMAAIKETIGYTSMFEYYDIKATLGKGKFGLVKSAIHKKTGKSVAVKVLSKRKMNAEEMTLQ